MEFGRIVSRAFEIAWRYKSLWVFGMLVMLVFLANLLTERYLGFIGSMVVVGLASLFVETISWGALIDSINRIERGGQYRLREAFSAGWRFFWRLLALSLAVYVPAGVVLFGAVVLIVLLFNVGLAVGLLSLLALVPAGLFFILALMTIERLAGLAVVVRKASIGDGLEEGYLLFMRNKVNSMVMALISLGLGIAFTIGAMIVFTIVIALPVVAFWVASDAGSATWNSEAILMGTPVWLVFSGFCSVLFVSFYNLFYYELLEPKGVMDTEMPPPTTELA